LKRFGIDTIDLFYQHRVDPNVPIEDCRRDGGTGEGKVVCHIGYLFVVRNQPALCIDRGIVDRIFRLGAPDARTRSWTRRELGIGLFIDSLGAVSAYGIPA
jgi:hypothetical protein